MAGEFKPGDRVRAPTGRLGTVSGIEGKRIIVLWDGIPVRDRGGWIADDLEPTPTSSPDTPEAGAAGERDALREELARAICRATHLRLFGPDRWRPTELDQKVDSYWQMWTDHADAILPIIDRHTAKALETALRERDEALREHTDMMWQRRRADERAAAAEAALSSEQSAQEAEREACKQIAFDYALADHKHANRAVQWNTAMGIAEAIRARASLSPTQESTHADA